MTEKPDETPDDPRLKFVWEEALRALEFQIASLNEIRGRSVALLSVASAAAFIGTVGLTAEASLRWTTWLGIGAFAAIGMGGAFVLFPRRRWKFYRKADELLDGYVESEDPASMDEMHRDLAVHLRTDYAANEKKLRWLYRCLSVSCLLLVVEIVAFLWDLRSRR